MLLDVSPDVVRVGSGRFPFKGVRLPWAEGVALMIALIIAAAAAYVWILGIIGLSGIPHVKFDDAMIAWLTEAELVLVLPIWLLLRAIDVILRMRTGRQA